MTLPEYITRIVVISQVAADPSPLSMTELG